MLLVAALVDAVRRHVGDRRVLDAIGREVEQLVAVDVGAGQEDDPQEILRQGLVAIHHRTFSIQSGNRRRQDVAQWDGPPLLFIRPRLEGYSTFDFNSLDYFLEEGYRAAIKALAGGPESLRGRPGS